jgi:hypothetical protein
VCTEKERKRKGQRGKTERKQSFFSFKLERTQSVCTEKERKRQRGKTERKQSFFSFFLKKINFFEKKMKKALFSV